MAAAASSWRAAFAALSELLDEGQAMIVLDEFQFIARQEPEIGSPAPPLLEHRARAARRRVLGPIHRPAASASPGSPGTGLGSKRNLAQEQSADGPRGPLLPSEP